MKTITFDASLSLAETLLTLKDREVPATVHLEGGTTLTGIIKGMSEDSILLAGLQGREFFDAMVRISAIIAVEARARGA